MTNTVDEHNSALVRFWNNSKFNAATTAWEFWKIIAAIYKEYALWRNTHPNDHCVGTYLTSICLSALCTRPEGQRFGVITLAAWEQWREQATRFCGLLPNQPRYYQAMTELLVVIQNPREVAVRSEVQAVLQEIVDQANAMDVALYQVAPQPDQEESTGSDVSVTRAVALRHRQFMYICATVRGAINVWEQLADAYRKCVTIRHRDIFLQAMVTYIPKEGSVLGRKLYEEVYAQVCRLTAAKIWLGETEQNVVNMDPLLALLRHILQPSPYIPPIAKEVFTEMLNNTTMADKASYLNRLGMNATPANTMPANYLLRSGGRRPPVNRAIDTLNLIAEQFPQCRKACLQAIHDLVQPELGE